MATIKPEFVGQKIYSKILDINIHIEDDPSLADNYIKAGLGHVVEQDKKEEKKK